MIIGISTIIPAVAFILMCFLLCSVSCYKKDGFYCHFQLYMVFVSIGVSAR